MGSRTPRWAGSCGEGSDRSEGHERRGRRPKDESGKPVANAARNTWVTETALTTALNVSYMAEQLALFSLIVGIALLLSGIGFVILALSVLGVRAKKAVEHRARRQLRGRLRHGRRRPTGCSDLPGH